MFFNFIEESEGIDFSEGQDVVSSTKLMSKSASHVDIITLLNKILNTKKMSDGCYHCIIYENNNNNLNF